jgi:mono/diheme cytochrome c family protein
MKRSKLLFIAVAALLLAHCTTQKKITYNIPPEYTPEQKKEFLAKMERGKKLYKEHCTNCHGIFKKGVDGMPDFTVQQINIYAERYITHEPQNHAVAMEMAPEQLDMILSFLRARATKGLQMDNDGRK